MLKSDVWRVCGLAAPAVWRYKTALEGLRKRTPSRYSTPPYIPITARARAVATRGEQLASIPLVEGRHALRGEKPNRSTLKQGCGGCRDRSEFKNRTEQNSSRSDIRDEARRVACRWFI